MPPQDYDPDQTQQPDPSQPYSVIGNGPADATQNGWGISAPHNNRALALESEKVTANDDAMNFLRQALNKSTEISPSQGIAAALLAAIPTIGGAMIGRAVGAPKIAPGTYFPKLSPQEFNQEFAGGMNQGGAEGAAIGAKASNQYLSSLQPDPAVLEKMAALKQQQAMQAGQDQNSVINAGLAANDSKDRLNQQEGFERDMVGVRNSADIDKERKLEQEGLGRYYESDSDKDTLDSHVRDLWASKLHVDPALLKTNSDLDRVMRANGLEGLNSRSQATIEERDKKYGQLGEKTSMDLAGPISIGKDVQQSIGELQKALGADPSLLGKAVDSLPTGSDAYNAMQQLKVDGARAAKALEGRVNDTTLGLYTDLLTSLNTEPLSAVVQRADRFNQALNSDAKLKLSVLSATGKNTDGVGAALGLSNGSAHPESFMTGSPNSGASPDNAGVNSSITQAPPGLSFDQFQAWKRSRGAGG